jgi:hypothetical protein
VARQSSTGNRLEPRIIAIRVAIVALIVGVGYLVFEFGRIQAGYDIVEAGEERDAYEGRISELEGRIVALKEEIAMLETHREIDREAYRDVEASLTELQAKIQEQQDAIAFYRGIVSPKDGNAGLRVQDFRLSRGAAEREYQLRLVLVQAMKHDRKVSGDVSLRIAGVENGEQKSYTYDDLKPAGEDRNFSFSFRYFQDFDRQLVLPDGFEPESVTVEVQSRTRSIASIEENFSWLSSQS